MRKGLLLTIYISIVLLIVLIKPASALPFNATWNTSKIGGTGSNGSTIVLPITGNYTVNWGDGMVDHNITNHSYSATGNGTYTINITNYGITSFSFNNGGDKLKIININQWGDLRVGNSGGYFYGCSDLNSTATDNLNLTGTTSLQSMFRGATNFNGNISGWNTSQVTDMNIMFNNAANFNQDISGWNTGKVTGMSWMFAGAANFNQNISGWNTGNVTDMSGMFYSAANFNQNISGWNTGQVTNMNNMFSGANNFNQNISGWNTGNVTDMSHMFYFTSNFNQNISGWNTGNVTKMVAMFFGATNFNRPIGTWNVSQVTDMNNMFSGASAFNQNLSLWNPTHVTDMTAMFDGVTLSTANYDALLNGWASRTEQSGVTFSGGNSKFSSAGAAGRSTLNTTYSWIITDGGFDASYGTSADGLQCFMYAGGTCPGNSVRLIGVQNDSLGWDNAHAQNNSYTTYAYSLCCNSTNSSITINLSCTGSGTTVIHLNASDNSHVETANWTTYGINACLNTSWQKMSCAYPASTCAVGYTCVMKLAGTEGTNSTNAHLSNCSSTYGQAVCCGATNRAPTNVTLWYPANQNLTVFERKPNFNWTTSTDPEGDTVYYELNVTCADGTCGAGCSFFQSSISTTNYTAQNALCTDKLYNWTVNACDNYGSCNISSIFQFNISSQAILTLLINTSDFGSMSGGENKFTTAGGAPAPIVARNDGNVIMNVTVNATSLFTTLPMNTINYRYNVSDNETGSINTACSQMSFTNMDSVYQNAFCNLSYVDINDQASLNFNITVPTDEPSGSKSSRVDLTPVKSET